MKITIGKLRRLIREAASPEAVIAAFNDPQWAGRSDHPDFAYIPSASERPATMSVRMKDLPGLDELVEDTQEFRSYIGDVLNKAIKVVDADVSLNKNMLFDIAENVHASSGFFGKQMDFHVVTGNYPKFIRTAEKFVRAAKNLSRNLASEVPHADDKGKRAITSFQSSVENISEVFDSLKERFESWKKKVKFEE